MWGTEPCSWTGSVGFEVGQPLEVCVCVNLVIAVPAFIMSLLLRSEGCNGVNVCCVLSLS